MPIPKTTPKAKRRQMNDRIILPICRPDEDNLSYLVTNALKQIVYKDDSQICKKVVHKYYSDDPRTVVTVTKMCTAYHNGTETEQEIICH
jgi:Holliday junction resolvase RusA-like endonuclease